MLAKALLLAVIVLLICGVVCADPPPPTQPDPISLDPMSPSVVLYGNTPSDIYGEAFGLTGMGWDVPLGTGPILHVSNWAYGLWAMDDNDAHSLGDNDPNMLPIVYFSANRRARGVWNTQYRHQANRNQAAGDRFVSNGWMNMSPAQSYTSGFAANLVFWQPGSGPNLLSANQTRYNEIPSIAPPVVNPTLNPTQIDDMDALELHPMDVTGDHMHDFPIYFSLAPGSPSMPPGGSPADIFVSPAGSGLFGTWASPWQMGLQATDNIDALVVFNVSGMGQVMPLIDYALFSLAPGNSLGASPSTVFVTSFTGFSTVYLWGPRLGLLGSDNLDGLDVEAGGPQGGTPQIWDAITMVNLPPLTGIPPAKANPDGTTVNVHAIVTLIGPDYIYIEEPTRASGIRVQGTPPWYVSLGDDLQVVGTIGRFDGERTIFPTEMTEMSIGNPIPAPFDMRTRSVGGDDYDALNPGITDGEGALNVGLLAKVVGMVTAVDTAAIPKWFYIWDGANRQGAALDDGTGNLGVRVDYTIGLIAPLVPWRDWVEVVGVVSTDAMVVAGRVIPLMLPTATPTVITTFDWIQSCSLLQGWNLTALPVAPAGSSDGVEHSAKPWDPPVIFAGGDPNQIDGRMYRWENCSGGLYIWDIWMDDHVSGGAWGPFGGALLGDGYWIQSFFDVAYTYSGKRSDQDKWVSVCAPGWMILGYPKENGMLWEDVKVHDGAQIVSLYDASQYGANWLNSMGYWWDASVQGLVDIGITEDWPSTLDMRSCHGYWFEFYEGNKSLIFPADATARFTQVDWNLDGIPTTNSEWGSLDLTFSRSPDPQYLNLNVNGSWQAQDLPLVSVGGTSGPTTVNIMFDLGAPRGMDVSNVYYGYTITNTPQYAVPAIHSNKSVGNRAFELWSGLSGSIAGPAEPATPIAGGKANDSAAHSKPFPNQEAGKNECVPAAVSNSLQFLNSQNSLGMSADAIDIGDMKSATGWTASGCGWTWYNHKAAWMAEHNLPINTSAQTASSGINMDDVINNIASGNDVEMVAKAPGGGGHCVAVTGCTKNANGTYSVTISHDTDQSDNTKGTKTEVVTYDPATGMFTGGSLNGWTLDHVVTESPKK